MKLCFKCSQEKPRSEFYRHAQMGDGLLGKCKDCTRKDSTARRDAKLEEVRAYDRARGSLPHRRAKNLLIHQRWKAQHPQRRTAQNMVAHAVKSGALVALPCLICGAKAEAHHPDYSAPLDVVWLCPAHHRQAHAMARRAA